MAYVLFANIKYRYKFIKYCDNDIEVRDIVMKHRNIITHAPQRATIIPIYADYDDMEYSNDIEPAMISIANSIGLDRVIYYLRYYPLYISKEDKK